ncbi:hypothetical protein ACFLUC_00510 [Chloroflexota bacterium]
MAKKKKQSGRDHRNLRIQQIIFIIIGLMIIITMVLSLVTN